MAFKRKNNAKLTPLVLFGHMGDASWGRTIVPTRLLATILAALLSVLTGCISIGEPIPPYGVETGTIVAAMRAKFPELRLGEFSQNWIGKNGRKPLVGTVPFEAWGGRKTPELFCDRTADSACISFAIGDLVNQHPGLLEQVVASLSAPCQTFDVPIKPYPGEPIPRAHDVKRTRLYFGCDGAEKVRRTIQLSIVRDLDGISRPNVSVNILKAAVIKKIIIVVNQ